MEMEGPQLTPHVAHNENSIASPHSQAEQSAVHDKTVAL
jgi:hypothetical protein